MSYLHLDQVMKMLERVMSAIQRHGYANYDSARADIGDEAWTVVERLGGWYSVCNNPGLETDEFREQFINTAESYFRVHGKRSHDYAEVKP